MSSRRDPYTRPKHPIAARLTERDRAILDAIHAYDGWLSLKQIDRLFFTGVGTSHARRRMRELFHAHYVKMYEALYGEPIFLLDKEGAREVALARGQDLNTFRYKDKPPRRYIPHDLLMRDFRVFYTLDCREIDSIELVKVVTERQLNTWRDTVRIKGEDTPKAVVPDEFFLVRSTIPLDNTSNKKPLFAFLVEVDRGNHDLTSFGREKVNAGMVYLMSKTYEERFGVRFGRWLVVCEGRGRMNSLRDVTLANGGQRAFYFTTADRFKPATDETPYRPGNVLKEPIWVTADSDEPFSLIPSAP